jgi:hypothetical protein
MELMQFLRMVVPHPGHADIGAQTQHFVSGATDTVIQTCNPNCPFCALIAAGDHAGIVVTTECHQLAEQSRAFQALRRRRNACQRIGSRLQALYAKWTARG